MSDYSTEDMREAFTAYWEEGGETFDRWLADHDRELVTNVLRIWMTETQGMNLDWPEIINRLERADARGGEQE